MTDRPPETALDRLRAGLARRNDSLPSADGPGPGPSPDPSKPVAAAPPPDDPAPMNEPASRPEQARQIWKTPQPVRPDAMQATARRRDLSRTRLRINLPWATAVTLGAAVIATVAYLSLPHMPDDRFRSLWPWRAHVWNRYGGHVLWCINEARKTNGPFVCQIHFQTDGPDCPRPETRDVTAAYLCPPWETWPTDPAPRWSADGPPHWSR